MINFHSIIVLCTGRQFHKTVYCGTDRIFAFHPRDSVDGFAPREAFGVSPHPTQQDADDDEAAPGCWKQQLFYRGRTLQCTCTFWAKAVKHRRAATDKLLNGNLSCRLFPLLQFFVRLAAVKVQTREMLESGNWENAAPCCNLLWFTSIQVELGEDMSLCMSRHS